MSKSKYFGTSYSDTPFWSTEYSWQPSLHRTDVHVRIYRQVNKYDENRKRFMIELIKTEHRDNKGNLHLEPLINVKVVGYKDTLHKAKLFVTENIKKLNNFFAGATGKKK